MKHKLRDWEWCWGLGFSSVMLMSLYTSFLCRTDLAMCLTYLVMSAVCSMGAFVAFEGRGTMTKAQEAEAYTADLSRKAAAPKDIILK